MVQSIEQFENWKGRPAHVWHLQSHVQSKVRVQRLLTDAAEALRAEDRRLRRLFGARDPQVRCKYRSEAKGLAYYLFEHNLVYTIFCSWIPSFWVVWDEDFVDSHKCRQHPPPPADKRQLIDLQVLSGDGSRWLFEAKWWMGGKGTLPVKNDMRRLMQLMKENSSVARAFELVFWYGEFEDLTRSLGQAVNKTHGLGSHVFTSLFKTQVVPWWRKDERKTAVVDGYFAFSAFDVGAS